MSNAHVISAAIAISNEIQPAESCLDDAAIASTALLHTMLVQHRAARAERQLGLVAIGHAMRAASLSVEAREATIRAHGALNTDLRKVGLDEMFSKGSDLPPNGPGPANPFTEARLAHADQVAARD